MKLNLSRRNDDLMPTTSIHTYHQPIVEGMLATLRMIDIDEAYAMLACVASELNKPLLEGMNALPDDERDAEMPTFHAMTALDNAFVDLIRKIRENQG